MERSPRFGGGVRRETFLNGSYSDYMREFSQRPPPPPHPMAQYGPPPGFYDQSGYTPHFDRPPRGGYPMGAGDYNQDSQRRAESRSKRSYERDVDDFIRKNSGLSSKHRSRDERGGYSHREQDRGRDRDRERDRDRDRDRERDYQRSERDYDRRDSDRERERDRRRRRERR